jgi:hypothetical protein
MKVPCPLPLQNPWSPVGYQVVEVENANAPDQTGSPPANTTKKRRPPEPPPVAWSPVGCQVVQVGEEHIPLPRRAPVRVRRYTEAPLRAPEQNVPVGAIVAGVIFIFFLLSLVVVPLMSRPHYYPPQVAWNGDVAVAEAKAAQARQIIVPEYAAKLPVREINFAPPAPDDKDAACPVGQPAQETFGTSVAFVRNPSEAAKVAKQQHKLLFILHVSGNFEESKFT